MSGPGIRDLYHYNLVRRGDTLISNRLILLFVYSVVLFFVVNVLIN